jgi:hypothetical protein
MAPETESTPATADITTRASAQRTLTAALSVATAESQKQQQRSQQELVFKERRRQHLL